MTCKSNFILNYFIGLVQKMSILVIFRINFRFRLHQPPPPQRSIFLKPVCLFRISSEKSSCIPVCDLLFQDNCLHPSTNYHNRIQWSHPFLPPLQGILEGQINNILFFKQQNGTLQLIFSLTSGIHLKISSLRQTKISLSSGGRNSTISSASLNFCFCFSIKFNCLVMVVSRAKPFLSNQNHNAIVCFLFPELVLPFY